MQPVQGTCDAYASFISVLQARHPQPSGNLLYGGSQSLRCLLHPTQQCSLGGMTATYFIKHFAGACHRNQLPLMQIHCERLHIRSVLHRCHHPRRKGAYTLLPTAQTGDFFHLMLAHPQLYLWQIMHLPALFHPACHFL